MKLQQIIDDFIHNKYGIDEYLKQVNILNSDEVSDIYSISETNLIDQRMHATIIFWLLKYKIMNLNNGIDNTYLSYLKDLIDGEIVKSVKFLSITTDTLVARVITDISHIYILINNSSGEMYFTLPKEIANQNVFCFNCNDEMELGLSLDIPEYSFYALKK